MGKSDKLFYQSSIKILVKLERQTKTTKTKSTASNWYFWLKEVKKKQKKAFFCSPMFNLTFRKLYAIPKILI